MQLQNTLGSMSPDQKNRIFSLADELREEDGSYLEPRDSIRPDRRSENGFDLMPLVTDLASLDLERGAVEALGYEWYGEMGIAGRRYCKQDIGGRRVAQLHFFAMGDPGAHRHLAFRDYLRAHPGIAAAYAAEKRRARDLHPGDHQAYGAERQAWIDRVEAEALAWYGQKA